MAQEIGVRSVSDLKKFGRDLKILSEQLSTTFHATQRKMQIVCEGWNDQVNIKFMDEFQRNTAEIDKIAAQMIQFSQFIDKSCNILEMYQHNKL